MELLGIWTNSPVAGDLRRPDARATSITCLIVYPINSPEILRDPVDHFECRHPVHNITGSHSLQWRHNDHDGVSNLQPHVCLLNQRWSKKTSKLRVTGLCAVNSPGTGEFPAQMASYAENVSIWWRHHVLNYPLGRTRLICSHPFACWEPLYQHGLT